MSAVFEIGGLGGFAILALPLALLATAVLMALFWPYRIAEVNVTTAQPSRTDKTKKPKAETRQSVSPRSETLPDAKPADTAPRAASAPPEDNTIEGSIDVATPYSLHGEVISRQIEPNPAREMLDAAVAKRAAGKQAEAAENLREAVILATKTGDRMVHAAARLELGDIAETQGDLQTACEHWQLARSLFEEESRESEAAKCEKRMSKNGCPTDWVLNDF